MNKTLTMPGANKGRPPNSDKAAEEVALWRKYKQANLRGVWLERALQSEQMYYNIQWNDDDMTAMRRRKMYPAVKNRLAPPARQVIQELSTNAPHGRVVSTSGGFIDSDVVLNGVIKHIEYISKRPREVSLTNKNLVVRGGIGWLMLIIDELSSDGLGDIKIVHIPNDQVFVSSTVTRIPDLDDAPCIMIGKPIPLGTALRQASEKKGLAERLKSAGVNFDPEKEESDFKGPDDANITVGHEREQENLHPDFATVYKIETYRLERRKRWQVKNRFTGQEYVTYDKNLSLIEKIGAFTGLIEKQRLSDVQRCKVRHVYAPDIFVSENWLELDCYPMTPFIAEDTNNLFPVDLLWFVRDEQKLLNRFESMRIQYIQLSMHGKIIIDKNATKEDKVNIKKNFAIIGQPLELEFTAEGKPMFMVYQPTVIPDAFILDAERAQAGIQKGMGIYSMSMGDPTNTPRTYAATLSLREWNKELRRTMLDLYNVSMEHLYDTIVKLIPTVYNQERVILYLDEDHVPQEIRINQQENDFWKQATSKYSTLVKDNQEFKIVGDLAKIKAQYRIIPDSFLPNDRMGMMQHMMELAKMTGGNPVFLKQALKFSNLINRAELIKELDMLPKLRSQLEQAYKVIEQLRKSVEEAQREELKARKSMVVKEHETRQAITTMKHKTNLEEREVRHDAKLDIIEKEAEIELERFMLQFQQKLLTSSKN